MLKKSLIAIAVLALAMPVYAGWIKTHSWELECSVKPELICSIPIELNVGYFIWIQNQDAIVLNQGEGSVPGTVDEGDPDTISDIYQNAFMSFVGYYDTDVISNFKAVLKFKITEPSTEVITGEKWTINTSLDGGATYAGDDTYAVGIGEEHVYVKISVTKVTLTDPDLLPTVNTQVATLDISVVPNATVSCGEYTLQWSV